MLEPGRATNLVVINSLKAAGAVRFPVYIGVLSMWGVAVPAAYSLGVYFSLGLKGIWIAFICDEWLRGIVMLLRWRGRQWKKLHFVKRKEERQHVKSGT